MSKKKIISFLSCFLFVTISLFVIGKINVDSKVFAIEVSGKKLLYDYDAQEWNGAYTTVDTTESVFPYGKMLNVSDGNLYISYAREYALTELTDWTGVKYLMFYVENTSASQQGVRIILNSLDPNYENAQQFIINPANSTGVVYLDNLETCVSATVSTSTNNIVVPKNFKGYIKVAVANPDNFKAFLSDGVVRTPALCLAEIQQVNYRGSNKINVDTLMVSYDNDITEVLSEEEVLCSRTVKGTNEILAIRDLYSENTGYGYWDGYQSMMSNFITYDKYYTEMNFNAPIQKTDATKIISPKEKFLEYTMQNDWSKAKYFVMEFENHAETVSQVYPKFVVHIDGVRTVFMKAGKMPMFLKNKEDGSITYLTAKETFNGKPLIQVPAEFDGYIVVPFADFAEGVNNTLTENGKRLIDYAENISTFNLQVTWYNYAQNFTVGTVGYTTNDKIKYETKLPKIVGEGIAETVANDNDITPIVGFIKDQVCEEEIASYKNGKFIIKGAFEKADMVEVKGFSELDKVNLKDYNFIIFNVKNNGGDASVLFKVYGEGANLYKLPFESRVYAKDAESSYINSDADTYAIIPADFDGQIIVSLDAFIGQNGNEPKFDKTKISGFGFAMPAKVETSLEFGVPYFAKSIKCWKEEANLIKLEQDAISVTVENTVTLGDSITLETRGGSTDGIVDYSVSEGIELATVIENEINFVKAGDLVLKVVKRGDDYYLDTEKFIAITVDKKTPVINNVSTTVYIGESVNIVCDTNSDGVTTVEYFVNEQWSTIAPTDVGEYKVKLSVVETDTYKYIEKEIFLYIVDKVIPVIESNPTLPTIYYGDTLADELLNGGVAKSDGEIVNGSFKFKEQNVLLDFVGEREFYITFVPEENYYASLDIALNITIEKAKITIIPDTLSSIYGEELVPLTYTVTGFKLNDTKDILSGNIAKAEGFAAGSYLINKGTLTANENYVIEIVESYYVIEKATPILEIFEFSSFVYENTDTSTLHFHDYTSSVEGKVDLEKVILVVGENQVGYTFIPNDTDNYNQVKGQIVMTAYELNVSSIEVKTGPTKLTYNKGENFDLTGLVINVKFNNGSYKEVSASEVTISNYDKNAIGKQTVTLNYRGKTTTVEIEVVKGGCGSNLNSSVLGLISLLVMMVVVTFKTIYKTKKNLY